MTTWLPDIATRQGPKYLAIADSIGEAIVAGTLPTGAKLPPQRNLAYDLGVTLGTVTRAYREVERRGLTGGEVGRGTFVLGDRRSQSDAFISQIPESPGTIELIHATPIALPAGGPLARTLHAIADNAGVDRLLDYQFNTGMDDHIDAGARWLTLCGMETESDNVTLTSGAQQGVLATLMATAEPGDTILVEKLTFPGVIHLARTLGYRLEAVDIDERGIVPDSLEHVARRTGAKILYCMPTLHNPTVVTMPEERRHAVADIAKRYGLVVIEDDIWGPLAETGIPPLAHILPEQTVHVSSLSKCLAGGFRIGYLRASRALTRKIRTAMRIISWMPAPLMAEVARRWIVDGTAHTVIDWQRKATARRVSIARKHLKDFDLTAHDSAHHMWLKLPGDWSGDNLKRELDDRGVRVLPVATFCPASLTKEPAAVRLAIGQPADEDRLERALEIISETLNGHQHRDEVVI